LFTHIPHPIDARVWNIAPDDAGYVAYVGRLSEEKGLKVLIAAARLTPNIKYKLVGTGEQAVELRALAADLTNVEFCGFKSGVELQTMIAQARLLVLPSVWYENAPLVVYEALALGTPVIASNHGGLTELIQHGKNGWLFTPGDARALAECLRVASTVKPLQIPENQYNKGTHLKQILEHYHAAIQHKSAS
jgi:glycosyltransferase involved in cell wall biosynthesis